ncbi:MAG: DUF2442 domain-containing protein [Deltaproteobacteria bacterium]|nr:DUF2442 domain-containing protein [Deltaproteobacteria bacterium]
MLLDQLQPVNSVFKFSAFLPSQEIALRKASLNQLSNYTLICRGTGIEWPELDYHLSIEAMLAEKRGSKAA